MTVGIWETPVGDQLFHGDNLAVLRLLPSESVTLAYMDPPFFTNRVHEMTDGRVAFDDRWPDQAAYLAMLAPRFVAMRNLLAPHGSLVVHVDSRTSHYVKVMLDEIFGLEAFASEIIWRYRRWPSKTPNFQRVHDVLLRYVKDPKVEPRWNQLYEPLAASTVKSWGTKKQKAEMMEDGKLKKRLKSTSTEAETDGVPMGDVWDIGILAPSGKERVGYPTQKPEALLERLVGALSDAGELILDPCAGSGTTLAVAAKMGRRFIGIDSSPVAVETMRVRLAPMVPREWREAWDVCCMEVGQ
jgi:site-specific DNA-methyltransferase (adenine-specific)